MIRPGFSYTHKTTNNYMTGALSPEKDEAKNE